MVSAGNFNRCEEDHQQGLRVLDRQLGMGEASEGFGGR